ncbi:hypothetical protein GY45DRAFT_1329538 [Cubamyces sp. BRFM 1775]|nr:hypothetical protein GY45DRAFT_1329538 [Cubamyces sp. BRFM 1775]
MFSSAGNYDSHRRSALHQGRRVECPMEDCGKHFVSIAAVFIHLESGACVSGVTVDDVARIAASVDRYDNVITVDDARWIADQVYDSLDRGSGWSGPWFECPICDDEVPTSSHALRQHIRSVHPIFHCPPDFGCGKRFGTLSALCQHVESGQCDVCDERDEVDRVVDDVLREVEA